MEDNGGIKVSGIRQIVKLKEMLQKWQTVTLSPRAAAAIKNNNNNNSNGEEEEEPRSSLDQFHAGISPAISRRLRSTASYCDSDEDSCQSPEPPFDVPKGYLAVYVGPELQLRRFIIPTTYLSHPLFKVLLKKVEEEFGFDHSGGLTIPCEVETFKYLLKCMETHQNDHHNQLDHDVDIDNLIRQNKLHGAGTSLTAEE